MEEKIEWEGIIRWTVYHSEVFNFQATQGVKLAMVGEGWPPPDYPQEINTAFRRLRKFVAQLYTGEI